MTRPRHSWKQWHELVVIFLFTGLLGCSSPPPRSDSPGVRAVPAQPNETTAPPQTVTFALDLKPGTKTRYRVTTETVTTVQDAVTVARDDASGAVTFKVRESSEVVFTQNILGPAPTDANAVMASVVIEQVTYSRTSPGQGDLAFDSREPAAPTSPFAKLIDQGYTIEISRLGYVPGVFDLRPVRLAVRGVGPDHAAATALVDPPAIFLRHGSFSLPGPDVGALAAGDRWRGLQQFTFDAPDANMGRLGTSRFEKIYRLERVEHRAAGRVAIVTFTGAPIARRTPDGRPAAVPFLSCVYGGGGEFNLDAGRAEDYAENLEVRMSASGFASPTAQGAEGRTVTVTRFCRIQRLDSD